MYIKKTMIEYDYFQWIFEKCEAHFLAHGFTWDQFLSEYLVTEWGPKVKLAHIELNKADVICRDFGLEAVKLMNPLSLPEVQLFLTKECLKKTVSL